jgi:hypothetical protein
MSRMKGPGEVRIRPLRALDEYPERRGGDHGAGLVTFTGGEDHLDSARRKAPVPALARWLLGLGIARPLAANVAHGLGHGLIGAVVAAWPAVTLIGSYELLMMVIRSSQVPVKDTSETGHEATHYRSGQPSCSPGISRRTVVLNVVHDRDERDRYRLAEVPGCDGPRRRSRR